MTETESSSDSGLIDDLRRLGPGPVGDALQQLGVRDFVIAPDVRLVAGNGSICGPAVTLKQIPTRGRTGTSKHIDVFYEAGAGDVVVIDTFRRYDVIVFGGRTALIAKTRNIKGVLIDGAVRDVAEIETTGVPVFAAAVQVSTPRLGEVLETQAINVPVMCGGALVNPDDLIVGNQEGAVVVPAERIADVAALARDLDESDKEQLEKIRAGLPKEEWYR